MTLFFKKKTSLILKEVDFSCREFLYNLANDKDVRSNAVNTTTIPWKEHCSWFERVLKSEKITIFILEKNGTPIGQIRFDEIGENLYEIDYALIPEERGKGLGKWLLANSIKSIELDNINFFATVKDSNISSKAVFESSGFTEFERFYKNETLFIKYILKTIQTNVRK